MRHLFVIDSPAALNPRTDSTIALIRAAARRGDSIALAMVEQLACDSHGVYVGADWVEISEADDWMRAQESAVLRCDDIDLVWMRKEPPVDEQFMTATRLLDMIAEKTPVINAPRALREWNEKLAILHFPDFIAPCWVGGNYADAVKFRQQYGAVVLKPLNGFGGRGVYVSLANDGNFHTVFDLLSDGGKNFIMVQEYLPAGQDHDSRVFVVNGKPLAQMLMRQPLADEHRGNMAAGGLPKACPLGAAERRIAEAVGGKLAEAGILFAGLDIIDGKLIEINITCPTGLVQVCDMTDEDPAEQILTALA